jgi:hypothetical protein
MLLTNTTGEKIHVNPEHVVMLHAPLPHEHPESAKAVVVTVVGPYAARESVEEVLRIFSESND